MDTINVLKEYVRNELWMGEMWREMEMMEMEKKKKKKRNQLTPVNLIDRREQARRASLGRIRNGVL